MGCDKCRGEGRAGYATRESVLQHVLATHVERGDEIPSPWFTVVGVRLCSHCSLFVPRGEACVGPRCTHFLLRMWENRFDRATPDDGVYSRPLSAAAPLGGEVALERVLGGKFAFARTVARGCADSVGRTLGKLLQALVARRTWGGVVSLATFPTACTQIGEARRQSTHWECAREINAMRAVWRR